MRKVERTVVTFHATRTAMRAAAKAGNGKAVDAGVDSPVGQRWTTVVTLTVEEAVARFHDVVIPRRRVEEQTAVCTRVNKNWYVRGSSSNVKVTIKRKLV